MHRTGLIISVILLVALRSGICYAQPAGFDSNCFYPKLGVADEYDTIMGSFDHQHLGDNLRTLPPLKGHPFSRLLMSGLPKHSPFISSCETGPSFDLHHLNVTKDYQSTPYQWVQDIFKYGYTFGHFHNSRQLDLVAFTGSGSSPVIFWANENGEYDSTRSTVLRPKATDSVVFLGQSDYFLPYVTRLSSDSVNDIVIALIVLPPRQDHPYFLAYFKGGEQLYEKGAVAMWDDTAQWTGRAGTDNAGRTYGSRAYTIAADFRGVGREDFVACDDWGNFFYYRNTPPFDIRKFTHAITYDTLLRYDAYSLYHPPQSNNNSTPLGFLTMQAFPKKNGDRSFDLLAVPSIGRDSAYRSGIYLFRGGPNFGDKRLFYDSCDYLIHHPGYYDVNFHDIQSWPGMECVGDITGTGNNVLVTGGGVGLGSGFRAFYVTGIALDDQIDLFDPDLHGAGWYDTIRASTKDIPMFIKSTPWAESSEDAAKGIHEVGGVQLLRGANKIPVRENPLWSSVRTLPMTDFNVEVYPNPTTKYVNVTFNGESSEDAVLTLYDVLGRVVLTENRMIFQGRQTIHVELPELQPGTYFLTMQGRYSGLRAKVSIF